ncbi:HYR domain-containing protein, partial [Marinirhabdus gelatinilytica]
MKKITLSLLALFVTCCVWQTSAQYMLDQAGTFAPIDISATGTNVTLGDDAVVADLPIGFTFNFYGNDYTDFDIASNGLMMFDGNGDNGCCSGEPLPIISASEPINFIAFAWEDLDPGNGGQPAVNVIRYATTGAAPNRILVMEFFNVDHFPSGNNVTTQVHLFETSNDIEIHTTAMPSDGGNHTMGIQNVDGSQSLAVPGRNGVDWSATNDYVRFFLPPPPPPPSDDACGVGLPAAFDPPSIISSDATITQTGVVGAAAGEYNLDFVSFDATSNWPNDITLTLTAPDGTTTITLSDGNGPGNAPGTEMDTEFRDDSANDVTAWSSGDMLADYQAEGGLLNTVFAGQPIDGVWTLTLDDVCCNDGGTWDEWCIEFTQNGVPPIIACPSDVMANSDPGECGAIVNFATPGAIDPEGGSVTVTQTMGPATGSLFPIGDTIVEFTATNDDAPNETATCQFTVTVVDNEAPTITCPADITQTNDPGVCGANITVPMP